MALGQWLLFRSAPVNPVVRRLRIRTKRLIEHEIQPHHPAIIGPSTASARSDGHAGVDWAHSQSLWWNHRRDRDRSTDRCRHRVHVFRHRDVWMERIAILFCDLHFALRRDSPGWAILKDRTNRLCPPTTE